MVSIGERNPMSTSRLRLGEEALPERDLSRSLPFSAGKQWQESVTKHGIVVNLGNSQMNRLAGSNGLCFRLP